MAESDISISEMTNGTFSAGAIFPAIQPDGQSSTGYSNVKLSGSDIGDGIGQLQFPFRLDTADKTIFGAINEAANAYVNILPTDTAQGSIASFPDGAANVPCISVNCQINPAQDLHGQDYPYPSGGGKNKLDFESWLTSKGVTFTKNGNSYTFNVSSLVGSSGAWTFNDTPISVTLSSNIINKTSTNVGFRLRNGSDVSSRGENLTYTATEVYLDWSTTGQVTIEEPMIRLSSATDPTYAPYSNICPITGHTELSLTQKDGNNTIIEVVVVSLGGTIYGGYIDIMTGALTINRAYYTVGDLTWGYSSGKFYSTDNLGMLKTTGKTIISSAYKPVDNITGSGATMDDFSVCCISNPAGLDRIYITDSYYSDETTFKSARSSVQLCFILAEPITVQLTGEVLKTVRGENSFYHDCNGDTTVTYKADIELYIDKKTS